MTSATVTAETILPFEQARELVSEHCERAGKLVPAVESVPLLHAVGRVLAEAVRADRDLPPFPRATRDGYALRSSDLERLPAELEVVGQIRAGGTLPSDFGSLASGQTFSIMTGAAVPAGADAVLMVEHSERAGNRMRALRRVSAGENVVPRGSEAKSGATLIERGTIVSYPQVGLAAAAGAASVAVFRKPRIAILPTGDEVVAITQQPAQNQIRNSNSFSLAAQVALAGGEPLQLSIAPDEPQRLRELILEGLEADLLLLSGGVSAGEFDYVEGVLREIHAEFLFTGVQIQPGKPLIFGRVPKPGLPERFTYFFGLPGNPISTMVTFELFAKMLVRAVAGACALPLHAPGARLVAPVRVKSGLTRFLPARLAGEWNSPQVEPVRWQGSGDLAAFAKADCLLVVPPDREEFAAGEMMCVIPLC